jgi:CHAD domain-containing protein
MNIEIEVKRLCEEGFSAEDLLVRLREVSSVDERGCELHRDVYFDTPKRCLSAAGLAARCRTRGSDRVLEVKLVPLIPELIMRRIEISEPWPLPQPAGPGLRRLIEDALGYRVEGRLEEQLALETRRQRYRVSTEGCRAELCIDDVAVQGKGDRSGERFSEVELELESGGERGFAAIAEVLSEAPRTRPSHKSKYARSLELLGWPAYRYGPAYPKLRVGESARVASRRVCGALLARLDAHRPGTQLGLDPEHLHKMRVATRRLRAALTSFGSCYGGKDRDWLQAELKWLAARLGEVRDLDVQKLDAAERRRASSPAMARGWKALGDELDGRWQRAHQSLRSELDGVRYREFLRRGWVTFSVPPRDEVRERGDDPVGMLASRLIQDRVRSFDKALAGWRRDPTPEAAHALRISGKKLRYTGLLFRDLGDCGLRARLRSLARLQDGLGMIQDRTVAGELARELRDAALERGDGGPYLVVLGQLIGESAASSGLAAAQVEHLLERLDVPEVVQEFISDARKLAKRTRRSRA